MTELSRTIYEKLRESGADVTEGSASPAQMSHIAQLTPPGTTTVGEIGFNTGHSAAAFLSSNPHAKLVSFDIGEHPYVDDAKTFIDKTFPGRHTLIVGDSMGTLPEYAREDTARFSMLFVDGGHDYRTALADIRNGRDATEPGATVIIDDLVAYRRSGIGPSLAWRAAIMSQLISPVERRLELPEAKKRGVGGQLLRVVRMRGWGVAHYN